MNLNAQDKEDLQQALLLLANAAGRYGIREAVMLRKVLATFPALPLDEMQAELDHLHKASLVTYDGSGKVLRPDLREWQSTAEGDRELMRRGLI